MLITNHIDSTLRRIYSKIGLDSKAIDARINQAMRLTNTNQYGSVGYSRGKGVGCAYDRNTGTYYPPIIASDDMEAAALRRVMAQDADTPVFNIPSSGAPLPQLTIWTQRAIEQIFKKMTSKELTGDFQQGTFGVRQVKIPTIGVS